MSDKDKPLTREELIAVIKREFPPEMLESMGAALRSIILEVRESEQEHCAKLCDANGQKKLAKAIRSRSHLFEGKHHE